MGQQVCHQQRQQQPDRPPSPAGIRRRPVTSRDQIMQRLASAQRFDEQIQLVAELDALDAAAAKTAQAERSLDWADTVVRETLAPGRTLDRHTASSDWLAVADTDPGEDHHHKVIAEA